MLKFGFTKHIPIPYYSIGLKVPLETKPTIFKFSSKTSEGGLTIPLPSTMNPTLFWGIPSFYLLYLILKKYFSLLSQNLLSEKFVFHFYEKKNIYLYKYFNFFLKKKFFLLFLTVHMRVHSAGVWVSFMSFPCRQRPASTRSESRAPSPAIFIFSF